MKKFIAIILILLSSNITYAQKSYSSGGKSVSPSKPSTSFRPPTSSKPPSISSPKPSYSPPKPSPKPSYSPKSTVPHTTPHVNSPPTISNDGKSKKPPSTSFNSEMSQSAKKEQSRIKYEATKPKETVTYKPAPTPKSTYTTPTGQTQTIKKDAPQVQTVRNYVTHERYVTYDNRASSFYGSYYGRPTYYNDSYSPFLMGWILSDAINSQQRATWMYHHQNDMDQARYNEMLARDSQLRAEIEALKAQNIARDPSYVPPQMADNPDVMFDKEFVEASYNPEPQQSGSYIWGFLCITITIVLIMTGVYFMFIKEYNV